MRDPGLDDYFIIAAAVINLACLVATLDSQLIPNRDPSYTDEIPAIKANSRVIRYKIRLGSSRWPDIKARWFRNGHDGRMYETGLRPERNILSLLRHC